MLEIVSVSTKRDLDAFIKIPGMLAANDPNWVEPLWLERKLFLSPKQNPYFQHADTAFWVAFYNGKPAGRISAQIDHLSATNEDHRIGFFGMIDARDDDVLDGLLKKAENWLSERNVESVRGPFSLSINETAGLLVDGFDSPPYVMMDHHDPWLGPALEKRGYSKVKDLVTYRLDTSNGLQDRFRSIAHRPYDGLTIRSINMKRYKEEIVTITSIFNDAWAGNWGFVPFTEAESASLASDLKPILDPELLKIAELDGKPVAFISLLPNTNEAIASLRGKLLPFGWLKLLWKLKVSGVRTARVPLMGVRQEISDTLIGKALPLQLIYALEERAVARNIHELELSWLLEDNKAVRSVVEAIGGQLSKTYRVFDKDLGSPS